MSTPVYIDVGLAPRVKMLGDPVPCPHREVTITPGELRSVSVLCDQCGYFKQVEPLVVRWEEVAL